MHYLTLTNNEPYIHYSIYSSFLMVVNKNTTSSFVLAQVHQRMLIVFFNLDFVEINVN